MRYKLLITLLIVVCTGCTKEETTQAITDTIQDVVEIAQEEEPVEIVLTDEQKASVATLNTYINNMDTLVNFTTDTEATGEVMLASENHTVKKELSIKSYHKEIAGTPYIKQITDEFIYVNDELRSKDSWASYLSGNTLAVENGDRFKWTSDVDNANVNYANIADKMILVSEDNILDIRVDDSGNKQIFYVEFNPEKITFNIAPFSIEQLAIDTVNKAELNVVVNKDTDLIEQSVFVTELVSRDTVKTKEGIIENAEDESAEYSKVPVVITERTETFYQNINKTTFDLPDLGTYRSGSPSSFSGEQTENTDDTKTIIKWR